MVEGILVFGTYSTSVPQTFISSSRSRRSMDYRDKIFDFVKKSPVVPGNIAKELQTNTIMAGAMLAEMCDRKILKTSALRVGGSPLYYVPGTESLLLNFRQSLNEKDRRAVERLEKELILRESELDPLTRVSLQQVKDFSYPLIVEHNGKEERFYKWFLLEDKDAEPLIRQKLEPEKAVLPEPQTPPLAPEVSKVDPPKQQLQEPKKEPKVKTDTKVEADSHKLPTTNNKLPTTNPQPSPSNLQPASVQQTLSPPDLSVLQGEFGDKVKAFFEKTGVIVKECSIIKKKTEFDLIIELPSAFGRLPYYCKVRSKKKLNESDISSAFVQGQLRKLPILLITDGELNKQGQSVLDQLKAVTLTRV